MAKSAGQSAQDLDPPDQRPTRNPGVFKLARAWGFHKRCGGAGTATFGSDSRRAALAAKTEPKRGSLSGLYAQTNRIGVAARRVATRAEGAVTALSR